VSVFTDLVEVGRVLRVEFVEPWNMGEFIATFPSARAHFDQVNHQVHALVVMSGITRDPNGVLRFREHPSFSHPRAGYTVFVGADRRARLIVETGLRLIGFRRYEFHPTEVEGRESLRRRIQDEQ